MLCFDLFHVFRGQACCAESDPGLSLDRVQNRAGAMPKYAVMDNIDTPRWQGHEEVLHGALHALFGLVNVFCDVVCIVAGVYAKADPWRRYLGCLQSTIVLVV